MNDSKADAPGSESILIRLMRLARVAGFAEMASGIAHGLNQPLGAIATFSQAGDRLLNRPEPLVAHAREVYQRIHTEAMTAGEEIRRIRGQFDHGHPIRANQQMADLVGELEPALQNLALGAEISLKVKMQAQLPEISVDRLRIQLVLFSLIENALEASVLNEGSQVDLEIRADRYAVETSVTDSGAGISAESIDKVFKPFFTTKPARAGLGLASSRATIEAHEGTIGFEKAMPMGCRFYFRLPIVPS